MAHDVLVRYPSAVGGKRPAHTSNYNLIAVPDALREAALERAGRDGLPVSLRHVLLALLAAYASGRVALVPPSEE